MSFSTGIGNLIKGTDHFRVGVRTWDIAQVWTGMSNAAKWSHRSWAYGMSWIKTISKHTGRAIHFLRSHGARMDLVPVWLALIVFFQNNLSSVLTLADRTAEKSC